MVCRFDPCPLRKRNATFALETSQSARPTSARVLERVVMTEFKNGFSSFKEKTQTVSHENHTRRMDRWCVVSD